MTFETDIKFDTKAKEILGRLANVDIDRAIVKGDIVVARDSQLYIVIGVPKSTEGTSVPPVSPVEPVEPISALGGWGSVNTVWENGRPTGNGFRQVAMENPRNVPGYMGEGRMLTLLRLDLNKDVDGTYSIIHLGHIQMFVDIDLVKLAILL